MTVFPAAPLLAAAANPKVAAVTLVMAANHVVLVAAPNFLFAVNWSKTLVADSADAVTAALDSLVPVYFDKNVILSVPLAA